MPVDTWSNVLVVSFQSLWSGIIQFLPQIVIAILILLIGWIVGMLLGRVVEQIVRSVRLDHALRQAGVDEVLRKANMVLDSGHFIGALVKWFVIIVFLVAALDVLRLYQVTNFLQEVVLTYLPQVIVAVLILLSAAVIGDVMQRIVTASAKTAEIKFATFGGKITKWAIWAFAILVALDQLGIATAFVQTIFTGFVVAVSLAIGLAFGLGGKDAAARLIEKTYEEIKHNKSDN